MASFSDNPNILGNFNPYIAQLPVSQMVEVGTKKQDRYDQGIQKIQGNIDNIAGLDVIRDVDKQYLQSKLNQLGGKLKTVAAGDFSNYQLVNSVGGMVTQIAKDPNIQNAVGSTMRVRKEQSLMEEADKAGKSSIQNKAKFNDDLNNWLNNTDVKTPFAGSYTQYIDVDKKLRDVAEKIHETDNSVDIPYQRDGSGNILYFSKDGKTGQVSTSTSPISGGTPKVDDAMLSIKTKGKPAEKILANFYDSLTEDDQNQLKIDGWYHYKGANKDTFINDATNNFNNNKKLLSDGIVNLNLLLTSSQNLSSAEKGQIQAKINDARTQLSNGSLEKDLQNQISQINNSPNVEDYKYKLYTQKYLTGLAKDISYQSVQQEYKTNPYFQSDMEKQRLQFQYNNANREQKNFEANLGLQYKEFSLNKEKFDWQMQQDMLKNNPVPPVGYPSNISTNVPAPTLNDIDNQITAISGNPKTNTPGAIDELNTKIAPLITGLKTPGEKKAYLDLLARKYAQDPNSVYSSDPDVKLYLANRFKLENEAARLHTIYNSVQEKSKIFDARVGEVISNIPDVIVNDKKYKATDLYNVSSNIQNILSTAIPIKNEENEDPYSQPSYLNNKEILYKLENYHQQVRGTNKEPIVIAYIKSYQGIPLTYEERALIDNSSKIKNLPIINQVNNDKLNFQSQELAKLSPNTQPTQFTLNLKNNKKDEQSVESIIGNAKKNYVNGGVDVNSNADYNPTTIESIRKDPHLSYIVQKNKDGSGNLFLISGDVQQTIPIKAEDFSQEFPTYARNSPMNDINDLIRKSTGKTTNALGGHEAKDATSAYLTGNDLPNFSQTKYASNVRVDVEGSPNNVGDANDLYKIRMYVNDKGVWKTDLVSGDRYLNNESLISTLRLLGPVTADELLKRNK